MLEAASLGEDLDFSGFAKYGELVIYGKTTREQCPERIRDADVILANKLMLDQGTLGQAENLKLICVTATGVNNVDLDYAKSRGIGVANVAGYSTASVAQRAQRARVPVLAFGGVISDGAAELYGMGVTAMQAINRSGLSAAAAAPRAGADLRRAAADACRMMLL